MDITELILHQHAEQRRSFALLDEVPPEDGDTLAAIWSRLEVELETHAEAEERFFYPRLLELGTGGGGAESADSETEDAIKDHNEIRDAIRAVAQHRPGSEQWWQKVLAAREANSDHMAEEEREDLADFRRHADLQTRHELALQFIRFECEHANGVRLVNKEPHEYVEENR